jgi:hypothetical protein
VGRDTSDFEDFRFPLHVCVSNDGLYLVFGGHSAHNMSFDTGYREGLRFYDADGVLVRFVTRRDLPRGYDGVSTSGWYDDSRSHITAHRFVFFTPGKDEPMEFDLESGELLTGELVPGQGDDSKSKLMERLRQRALEEDDDA